MRYGEAVHRMSGQTTCQHERKSCYKRSGESKPVLLLRNVRGKGMKTKATHVQTEVSDLYVHNGTAAQSY